MIYFMDKASLLVLVILWITYKNVLSANGLQMDCQEFVFFLKSKDLPQFIEERSRWHIIKHS